MNENVNDTFLQLITFFSKRIKVWLLLLIVIFGGFIAYSFIAKFEYESHTVFQVRESAGASGFGLSKAGMLGSLMSSMGDEYTAQILESRELKVALIKKFNLMQSLKVKKIDFAIKKLDKMLLIEELDDDFFKVYFVYGSADTAKLAIDFVIDYVNKKQIYLKKKYAQQKYDLYQERLNNQLKALELFSDSVVSFMGNNKVYEIESQTKQVFQAVSDVDQEILTTSIELSTLFDNVWKEGGAQQKALQGKLNSLKSYREALMNGNGSFGKLSPKIEKMPQLAQKLKMYDNKLNYLQELMLLTIPQLEKYSLDLMDTTSNVVILDPAYVPEHKKRPIRSIIWLLGLAAGVIISTLCLFIWGILYDPLLRNSTSAKFVNTIRKAWKHD